MTDSEDKKRQDSVLVSGAKFLRDAAESVLNSTKFISDPVYRRTTGIPWLRRVIAGNAEKIWKEVKESEEMMQLLWKYASERDLSPEENAKVKAQLTDIVRVVPALGIFALPGGAVLLPLLAKILPWDLAPSAFREKVGIEMEDIERVMKGAESGSKEEKESTKKE